MAACGSVTCEDADDDEEEVEEAVEEVEYPITRPPELMGAL